jgi:hypothetical protein
MPPARPPAITRVADNAASGTGVHNWLELGRATN